MKSIWNKTDASVKEIYSLLVRDFRRFDCHPILDKSRKALYQSVAAFRNLEWPVMGEVDPYVFKIRWQLQNFLKRHRFSDDVFSDQQLEEKTNNSFLKTQERLSQVVGCKGYVYPVLQEARRVAISILGRQPDTKELLQHCRIGKRATLGCTLSHAYIDYKLSAPSSFTCPSNVRKWFFGKYLPTDRILQGIVRVLFRTAKEDGELLPLSEDYLNLANVPKSWKSFRGITPLSLIGLFLSYGIKALVEKALKEKGKLDIKTLQQRHKKLAQRYSKSRTHATVDLTEASNSIKSTLLMSILPYQWYKLLKSTFVRTVNVGGKSCYSETVLLMGNAATFPVETLAFYCLIKAVGNLLNVKGTYSVYGDDLIYPVAIHRHVVAVFAQLGLLVNAEKSFASLSSFRESCGGDYYRGVDVRPALAPEFNAEVLTCLEYQAWLYKTYNALSRRWSYWEIPSTMNYILSEIAYVGSVIHIVPPSYPDFSGIKELPPKFSWLPLSYPKSYFDKCKGCRQLRFTHLSIVVPDRVVSSETAFYWEWMKSRSSIEEEELSFGSHTPAFRWLMQLSNRVLKTYGYLPKFKVNDSVEQLQHKWRWERRRVGTVHVSQYVPSKAVYCKVKDEFRLTSQGSSIPYWA